MINDKQRDCETVVQSAVGRFLSAMLRRPPRSTRVRSSAASGVYKRQVMPPVRELRDQTGAVHYTHLRAHETALDRVCGLLLEKKKNKRQRR